MTTQLPVIKNDPAGAILYTALVSQATPAAFQAAPTLAAGDAKISIDGGAFANLGTLPAVLPAAGKTVKITLSQAETNGDNLVIVFSDAAGGEWCDQFIQIQTAARHLNDLAFPVTAGNGLAVDGNGRVSVASFAAGAIDANAIAADAIGASELAADAVTEIQAGLSRLTLGDIPTANQNADALLDRSAGVETGLTVRQAFRLFAAALLGKAAGMNTTTATFRDTGDLKNRITATVDVNGNRTAVNLDPT
jgi:hypothetical protein